MTTHVIYDCASRSTQTVAMTAEEIAARNAPPQDQTVYTRAIQSLIDQTAASRQYADGVALASYATSTVPAWAAEAAAFIAWRDSVWAYAYAQFAAVQSSQRPQPHVGEFLAELPTITWP